MVRDCVYGTLASRADCPFYAVLAQIVGILYHRWHIDALAEDDFNRLGYSQSILVVALEKGRF